MLEELPTQLESATLTFAQTVAEKFAAEKIYCVALYTSGDYRYVVDTFSTEKGLQAVAAKYLKDKNYQKEWGTLEVAMRELKWSPCDSPHHGKFERLFERVNELIEAIWEATDDDDDMYLATCKRIHASCIASLTALRNANIFDDSVVLNLLMGDQSDEERLLNAEGINPHATLKKFRGELQVDLKRLADLRKSRWKW